MSTLGLKFDQLKQILDEIIKGHMQIQEATEGWDWWQQVHNHNYESQKMRKEEQRTDSRFGREWEWRSSTRFSEGSDNEDGGWEHWQSKLSRKRKKKPPDFGEVNDLSEKISSNAEYK
jgi:hypothetical protein